MANSKQPPKGVTPMPLMFTRAEIEALLEQLSHCWIPSRLYDAHRSAVAKLEQMREALR